MIPAIQNLINYLNPTTTHRIANLSPHDPFVIFGFILLALIVPISLLLLTVVARRSVYSIMDRVRHEGIYRRLRRSAKGRERRSVAPLLPVRRSEEGLRSGDGRMAFEGMEKRGKDGGGERKEVAFADAGSNDAVPEQKQQALFLSAVTRNPLTSAREEERKEQRAKLPPQTAPTRLPPSQPTQRPPHSSASPYVSESIAAAESQPPLASQPAPGRLPPSKPTKHPSHPSPTPQTSREPASVYIQPPFSPQTATKRPERSPIEPTFEALYDQWNAAQRAPRIDLAFEEGPEAKREWVVELQAEVRGAGLRAKLGE